MMKRFLLASLLLATPAMAQTAAPPNPTMLDGTTRGIRPLAPQPNASGAVRQTSIAPSTQSDHDYMTRLAVQLQETIGVSKSQLQASQNPAVQRTARHIVTTRQRELDAVNRWLAHHPA
jgi:uncharacterized protein (DUF305 family)